MPSMMAYVRTYGLRYMGNSNKSMQYIIRYYQKIHFQWRFFTLSVTFGPFVSSVALAWSMKQRALKITRESSVDGCMLELYRHNKQWKTLFVYIRIIRLIIYTICADKGNLNNYFQFNIKHCQYQENHYRIKPLCDGLPLHSPLMENITHESWPEGPAVMLLSAPIIILKSRDTVDLHV